MTDDTKHGAARTIDERSKRGCTFGCACAECRYERAMEVLADTLTRLEVVSGMVAPDARGYDTREEMIAHRLIRDVEHFIWEFQEDQDHLAREAARASTAEVAQ